MFKVAVAMTFMCVSLISAANECQNKKFFLYDTIPQAREAGVNYGLELNGARKKNKESLNRLFLISLKLDGSGSQSHSGVLMSLLKCWGDVAFSRVLKKHKSEVRNKVIESLDFESLEWDRSYSHDFPETYKLGIHRLKRTSNNTLKQGRGKASRPLAKR